MGVPQVRISDNETSMLVEIAELIKGADLVCAHNIGYDLGFLAVRWALNDIQPPKLHDHNPEYWGQKFKCTKAMWKPRASSTMQPASLDYVGRAFGMGSKPGNGKYF